MNELKDAEGDGAEAEEFRRMNTELHNYSKKMDSILDKFIRSDENWFLRSIKSLLT